MDPVSASIMAGASLGSAGIGVIGANASTKKQYKYQSKLQAQAAKLNYDYSILSAKNLHSATREGLENAGYNPMLAVQNGTSGANSSFTSAGQASAPDYVSGMSAGIANAQSFQRLENETTVADNTSKKLEAEGENLNADTANKLEENKYIGEKRKKEIANIQADTLHKEAQIDNMKKQVELGYANLAVTRRGQDKVYNASTFNSTLSHPYARFGHKVYKSGSGSAGRSRDGRTAREIVGW